MEVATDLTAALPSAADLGLAQQLDARGIPVPPALPTEEDLHKHYLIPVAPALPTSEMLHKHYLIPMAPPLPTKEDLNRHYLSRDRTLENVQSSVQSAASLISEVASDLTQSVLGSVRAAPEVSMSSQDHIPVPPALPTSEMLHKHYLIPLAPALPTEEDMNRHYLSRNKTIENAQSSIASAFNLISEVASDVKAYVMETPLSAYPADIKEAIHPTPVDAQGIPIPPAMPTSEMLHKHYLIPVAPALPTSEQMHRHYLSRNKTVENMQSSVASAATFVSEVAADLTNAATSTVRAIPAAASEAGSAASSKIIDASEVASESISATVEKVTEVVAEKAQEIKEKVMPSATKGAVYTRGADSISESPILRKNVSVGSRRIVPRQNYEGFKPLLQ